MPHYKKLFDPRFIGSWDLNGDGMVNGLDLAQLLAHWNH